MPSPHPSEDPRQAIGSEPPDEEGDTVANRQLHARRPEGIHPSIVPFDDAPSHMHPELAPAAGTAEDGGSSAESKSS